MKILWKMSLIRLKNKAIYWFSWLKYLNFWIIWKLKDMLYDILIWSGLLINKIINIDIWQNTLSIDHYAKDF